MSALHTTKLPTPCKPVDQGVLDRFWPKVNVLGENDCWEWKASRNSWGYGQFWFRNTIWLSHRAAYTIFAGDFPQEKIVMHSCDNPPCVNPAHLKMGTIQDNNDDMSAKGRNLAGEAHKNSVLTYEQVGEARERVKAGEAIADVARSLGVKRPTLHEAVRGVSWNRHHIPPVMSRRR